MIPFAAYNLFEDDFKLKTQFFIKKPNVGFFKTEKSIHRLKREPAFQQAIKTLPNETSRINFIQTGVGRKAKFYAHIQQKGSQDQFILLNQTQYNTLEPYFKNIENNTYNIFDQNDLVCAPEFEVKKTTLRNVNVLHSKKPSEEKNKKSLYFKQAYQLQSLVKKLANKSALPYQDQCVHLTRYDYFSDDYIESLQNNDLELVGIDRGVKSEYGEIFSQGEIQNIQTGFGKHKHGIMLPQIPDTITLNTVEDIKNNMTPEDVGVIDLLYENKTKQEYDATNELFFGYHNIIPNTDISALPISGYVKTCLDITQKTNGKSRKNVDFILNTYQDNADACSSSQISEILKGIDRNQYDVEFWKKNSDNKIEKCQSFGACDGQKPLVRLINPFGIKHQSFLTLLRLAEPFTLQTGNSSIIEALYLEKVPLYQLTTWSEDFLNALEKYISDTLGKDSHYATIFRTANDKNNSQDEKIQIISEIYRKHLPEIKSELKDLVSHLKDNMNLYKNFPTLLQEKFKIPLQEKRVHKQPNAPLFSPPKAWIPQFRILRNRNANNKHARRIRVK